MLCQGVKDEERNEPTGRVLMQAGTVGGTEGDVGKESSPGEGTLEPDKWECAEDISRTNPAYSKAPKHGKGCRGCRMANTARAGAA